MKFFRVVLCILALSSNSAFAAKSPCKDDGLVYKHCHQQEPIYKHGLAKAKAQKKLLLVQFGFESCPWCQNLHRVFTRGELQKYVGKNFVFTEIDITSKSGKALFDKIKGKYDKPANKTGFPFLLVINPKTLKSDYQDTGVLEDNSHGKGHNVAKVQSALERLRKELAYKKTNEGQG